MDKLNRDRRDTTDPVDAKLRRAVDWVEHGRGDRWPIRGQANVKPREWRPFEDVNRGGREEEYLGRPKAKR